MTTKLIPLLSTLSPIALLAACAAGVEPDSQESSAQALTDNRANVDGYFVTPAASTFKLKPGSIGQVSWKYTTTEPASGWAKPGFSTSGWSTGYPGFWAGGAAPGDVQRTAWPDAKPDLWLRTTFSLSSSDVGKAMFWGRWDDEIEVYINGVLATKEAGWSAGYRYLGLTAAGRAALKGGSTNTLAVHAKDTGGGRYFDLGVTLNSTLVNRPRDEAGFERNPALAVFGETVKTFMIEHGIPAGVVAVMKQDQVVVNRAYGWKDKAFTTPLTANAVLRLASNDKVITRAAVRSILDANTIDPTTGQVISASTPIFPLLARLGLTPIPGATVPASINQVTIQHLIDHRSGVQELPGSDTLYSELGVAPGTSTQTDNVRWVYSKETGFVPGTVERYSSSGYMVLRYFVQALKGDLVTYLRNTIFAPVGSSDVFLAFERLENRSPREPWYATLEAPYDRWINLENYTALGATAESMIRFLRRYHIGFGKPMVDPITGGYLATPDNGGGVGGGGMAGTTSLVLQRRWDEVSIAVIFNIGGNYDAIITRLEEIAAGLPSSAWGV